MAEYGAQGAVPGPVSKSTRRSPSDAYALWVNGFRKRATSIVGGASVTRQLEAMS
jgi:hypothetical protein